MRGAGEDGGGRVRGAGEAAGVGVAGGGEGPAAVGLVAEELLDRDGVGGVCWLSVTAAGGVGEVGGPALEGRYMVTYRAAVAPTRAAQTPLSRGSRQGSAERALAQLNE